MSLTTTTHAKPWLDRVFTIDVVAQMPENLLPDCIGWWGRALQGECWKYMVDRATASQVIPSLFSLAEFEKTISPARFNSVSMFLLSQESKQSYEDPLLEYVRDTLGDRLTCWQALVNPRNWEDVAQVLELLQDPDLKRKTLFSANWTLRWLNDRDRYWDVEVRQLVKVLSKVVQQRPSKIPGRVLRQLNELRARLDGALLIQEPDSHWNRSVDCVWCSYPADVDVVDRFNTEQVLLWFDAVESLTALNVDRCRRYGWETTGPGCPYAEIRQLARAQVLSLSAGAS